jgi:sarcosine oxidase, subunit beta
VRKLAAGYALAAQATGKATFLVNTEVVEVAFQSGRVAAVNTNRGFISTGTALIAAGPFSGVVGALAGIDIPLSLVRRQ